MGRKKKELSTCQKMLQEWYESQEYKDILARKARELKVLEEKSNEIIKQIPIKYTGPQMIHDMTQGASLYEVEYLWAYGLEEREDGLYITFREVVSNSNKPNSARMNWDMFKKVVKENNCKKVIVSHNHDFSAKPSNADFRFTYAAYESAKINKVELYDHVIVANRDPNEVNVYSFREHGELGE